MRFSLLALCAAMAAAEEDHFSVKPMLISMPPVLISTQRDAIPEKCLSTKTMWTALDQEGSVAFSDLDALLAVPVETDYRASSVLACKDADGGFAGMRLTLASATEGKTKAELSAIGSLADQGCQSGLFDSKVTKVIVRQNEITGKIIVFQTASVELNPWGVEGSSEQSLAAVTFGENEAFMGFSGAFIGSELSALNLISLDTNCLTPPAHNTPTAEEKTTSPGKEQQERDLTFTSKKELTFTSKQESDRNILPWIVIPVAVAIALALIIWIIIQSRRHNHPIGTVVIANASTDSEHKVVENAEDPEAGDANEVDETAIQQNFEDPDQTNQNGMSSLNKIVDADAR